MKIANVVWLLLSAVSVSQIIQPSNNSADIRDASSSPRFWINATGAVTFPGFLVAPLGHYASISRQDFRSISFSGILVDTDATNANQYSSDDFNFIPCDPEEYDGGNMNVDGVLRLLTNAQQNSRDKSSLIFYSTRSKICNASAVMDTLPGVNGIFTTVDPVVASQVANRNFTGTSNAIATLTPDYTAYYSGQGPPYTGQPSTAIAMIVLYAITGIITSLFVIIIITGAIRAHRHPERYGPRNSMGRPRQSRAKGIARAMLETIPIIKFGDHQDLPKNEQNQRGDVEMAAKTTSEAVEGAKDEDGNAKEKTVDVTTESVGSSSQSTTSTKENGNEIKGADGSDEAGGLGCSICTEDFEKGDEVRVLPCNHKFHPDCVDPWLLNVSGTCPLCRINLAPEGEQEGNGDIAPPLNPAAGPADRRSQAIHSLMAIAYGSREERISALRRYRAERRNRHRQSEVEETRISRAQAFRDAFRIRTRTHEPNEVERRMRNSGVEALSNPPGRI